MSLPQGHESPIGRRSGYYIAFAVIVIASTFRALQHPLWDDALFFQRIGFNLIHSGVAAWNVVDGPVHGSTSQLFQLVSAVIVGLAPGYYQLAIRLFLGACAFLAFVLATLAIPKERTLMPVVFCGFCAPTMLLLIESGMETLLALATVALALLTIEWARTHRFGSPTRELSAFVASQLLVYLARPDLMLITAIPSLVLVDWRAGLFRQRRYLRMILGVVIGLIGLLIAFHGYYGTALPLSFYVKNRALTHYDADYKALDIPGSTRQITTWLLIALPFLYVALFRLRSLQVALLLIAAFALVAYQLGFTLEVMGYHTRYFMPALLPVFLAAVAAWPDFMGSRGASAKALVVLVGWPVLWWIALRYRRIEAPGIDDPASWISPGQYMMYVVPTLCLFLTPLLTVRWQRLVAVLVPVTALAICAVRPWRWPSAIDDAAIEMATAPAWPGLADVKRCIREPMHMYQTELGLPGVMFLGSRITDLSGLMNPRLAFGQGDFDTDCLQDSPEVIFLPHWTHQHFRERVLNSRCIRAYVSPERMPPSGTPLYIRRDILASFEQCRGVR